MTRNREVPFRHWICRGWSEHYSPENAPHQWMHAYYEVPKDRPCDICTATEEDPKRWDGESNPFLDEGEWEDHV